MGFLETLAAEMTASRRANSIATTAAPYMGGAAAPSGGLLSRLIGLNDTNTLASPSPSPPSAVTGFLAATAPGGSHEQPTVPDMAPQQGGLLSRLLGIGQQPTAAPAPPINSPAPSVNAMPAAAMPYASTGPQQDRADGPRYAAMPAGPLASFAAGNSTNPQRALQFYQAKGLSPLGAAAIVGGTAITGGVTNPL